MTPSLSVPETKLLDTLQRRLDAQAPSPTFEELRVALRLTSKNQVSQLVAGLEQRGYIARAAGRKRTLTLLRGSDGRPYHLTRVVHVPLLGLAPASFGQDTLDGFAPDEYLALTQDLVPDETGLYALRVSGDSLSDAHINDGDLVVLRQQQEASDGDLVQVWLRREDAATVKRYFRQGKIIWLHPENRALKPRCYPEEDVRVQGKVVLVLRSLERALAA
ncbi:MAG: repressor LexA [Caldilineales bacterium]|nr:repressor LexA [Caldilineales bacterium]